MNEARGFVGVLVGVHACAHRHREFVEFIIGHCGNANDLSFLHESHSAETHDMIWTVCIDEISFSRLLGVLRQVVWLIS